MGSTQGQGRGLPERWAVLPRKFTNHLHRIEIGILLGFSERERDRGKKGGREAGRRENRRGEERGGNGRGGEGKKKKKTKQ